MEAPRFKEVRRAYGFDEVAIAPGSFTINPDQTSTHFSIDGMTMSMPILAAAMDAIVSPSFAAKFDDLGGMAVMNLEGVHTRYEDSDAMLEEIVEAPKEEATNVLQRVYTAPIQEHLIGERVEEIKSSGAKCAVSVTPASTKRLAPGRRGRGRHHRRPVDGDHREARLEEQAGPRLLRPAGDDQRAGPRRELRVIRGRAGADGDRHPRGAGGRRAGSGLHHARGDRCGCAPGDRDHRVRGGQGRVPPPDRALRAHHHRRGHPHGRATCARRSPAGPTP